MGPRAPGARDPKPPKTNFRPKMGRGSSPNGSAPPGTPFLPRETPNGATSTPFRPFLMFFVVFPCKNNTWGAHGAPMGAHGAPMGRPWGAHGRHFPAKSAKIVVLYSLFEPPGILHTIYRIQRKRNMASRTDPGFPMLGGRMTVVYTNSRK